MIQLRIYRGRAQHQVAEASDAAATWRAHRERELVLEEVFRDRSLRARSALGAPDTSWGGARDKLTAHECAELLVDVDGSVEHAVVRLIDVLADAVRTQRIADFRMSLADGTTIACPKGRAIQVSWPSLLGAAPAAAARGAMELASYLAEQLGPGAARLR
jgi:hypothetical protein